MIRKLPTIRMTTTALEPAAETDEARERARARRTGRCARTRSTSCASARDGMLAGLELEDDGFRGDDTPHLRTDHPHRHGHVPYRGPWTSTASSCATPGRGAGSKSSPPGPGGRGSRSLAPAEIDEFVALYQRTAAQLSHARGYYDDPGLTARLTTLVASANAALYGTRPASLRGLRRFFTETFPAAIWYSRRFVLASAALMFVPMIVLRRVDRELRARARRRGPQGAAGSAARVALRGLLLVEARVRVLDAGADQQHPGVVPRVRRWRAAVPRHRGDPRAERHQRRHRRRAVRARAGGRQVLRTDPAARPARAHQRDDRGRGRVAHRLGDHRARRPASRPPRSPRRVGGRS